MSTTFTTGAVDPGTGLNVAMARPGTNNSAGDNQIANIGSPDDGHDLWAISGGKGPVKAASGDFADGALATLGLKADAAATDSTSAWSAIALLKGAYNRLAAIATSVAGVLTVSLRANANADGLAGTAIDEVVLGAVGPGGTVQRVGMLADSGYGQRTLLHCGAVNSVNTTQSPRATTQTFPIANIADAGVNWRVVQIYNTLDQPVILEVILLVDSLPLQTFTCTLAQNPSHLYTMTPFGVFRDDGVPTGVALDAGNYDLFSLPADQIQVNYQFLAAPTSGALQINYRGLT